MLSIRKSAMNRGSLNRMLPDRCITLPNIYLHRLKKVIEEVSRKPLAPGTSSVILEMTVDDVDDAEIEIPAVAVMLTD